MSKFLYNLGIVGYRLAVRIFFPFNDKAKQWVLGRKDWKNRLVESLGKLNSKKPVVWFHASSLGEFEQGRPVMEALKKEKDINLVLTFFSPSGYEMIKKWPTADLICYLPIDTHKNATEFIRLIKPVVAVFIKYEFWFHYLNQLNKQKIKTYLISTRFYPEQLFFKSWARWYRKMLFLIDKIYAQDNDSVNLLSGIGYHDVELAGDTRYDRVEELSRNTDRFPEIEKFIKSEKLVIAGSSWPLDEALFCNYINLFPESFKYLIAPHDIGENHLKKIESLLKVPFQRHSAYDGKKPARVLILDSIGMLSRVYKYAVIAYIGGAFKEGLHNILEPAGYGVPVITGPDHKGFPEGPEMEKAGALIRVNNFEDFKRVMNRWESDNENRARAANAAKNFVQSRTGATKKITKNIVTLLTK